MAAEKINIAVFASGSGSNAENLVHYFKNHDAIHVKIIISNNPSAGVLERAKRLGITSMIVDKELLHNEHALTAILDEQNIKFIVLAGFLLKIPDWMVRRYKDKIINIHPSLLPKYGGKGMYGIRVHEAVREAREYETGITVHLVNEHYDEGRILMQAKCKVTEDMSAEDIAEKVHALEYSYFPVAIAHHILNFRD